MKKLPFTLEELKAELQIHGMNESGLCEAISDVGSDMDYVSFPDSGDFHGFFLIHLVHGLAILPYRYVTGHFSEQLVEEEFRYVGEDELVWLEKAERNVRRMQEALEFTREKTRLFHLYEEGEDTDGNQ